MVGSSFDGSLRFAQGRKDAGGKFFKQGRYEAALEKLGAAQRTVFWCSSLSSFSGDMFEYLVLLKGLLFWNDHVEFFFSPTNRQKSMAITPGWSESKTNFSLKSLCLLFGASEEIQQFAWDGLVACWFGGQLVAADA